MRNKFISPLFVLVTASILIRIIVYLLLPPVKELASYPVADTLYFSALTEHFKDYITFTSQIPPVTHVLNAGVLWLMGAKTAVHLRGFLLLVSIMDIAAVTLLYRASQRMNASKKYSFVILLLFSIILIPFEIWRNGLHYDHHTVFFTSFFAFTLVKLISHKNSLSGKWLLSLSAALLVAQSAVNSAVVPFSVIAVLCFLYLFKKQYITFFISLLITLLLPFIVLFLLSHKNQSAGNEALTSNKGGPAMMMVVQRAYQYDSAQVKILAKEMNAPEWYLWAYDHYTVPVDPITGKKITEGWWNLSQAFGICFFGEPGSANGPWALDFHALINHLRETNQTELVKQEMADSADASIRPYRFAGFSWELSPRWIGTYGNLSKKIYFSAFAKQPAGMLKACMVQQGVFAVYGPLFPYNTTQNKPSLLAHAGLRSLETALPLQPLFIAATLLFALLGWIIYLLAWFNIPLLCWRWFTRKKSEHTASLLNPFQLLCIPMLSIAVVFSCLVGGENDRYFMQATPYIVLLATVLPNWFRTKK